MKCHPILLLPFIVSILLISSDYSLSDFIDDVSILNETRKKRSLEEAASEEEWSTAEVSDAKDLSFDTSKLDGIKNQLQQIKDKLKCLVMKCDGKKIIKGELVHAEVVSHEDYHGGGGWAGSMQSKISAPPAWSPGPPAPRPGPPYSLPGPPKYMSSDHPSTSRTWSSSSDTSRISYSKERGSDSPITWAQSKPSWQSSASSERDIPSAPPPDYRSDFPRKAATKDRPWPEVIVINMPENV